MEIVGSYNERGELNLSTLKNNLESHLGIDTSNIGTTLPTGTITLDNIDFYINSDEEVIEGTAIANGSWNSEKGVNSPELFEGMTAIYWDDYGVEHELTEASSEEEWDNWYDYNGDGDGQNKWANAVTKDENGNITGYWVWIPRYAYKIESGLFTSTAGEISVKFLQGTSDLDENGDTISREYSYTLDNENEVNNHMNDYVVHPAFRDGTSNNFMNGEWDEEVTGFWIAKYEAGYQANTITDNNGTLSTDISNSSDTVVYSDLKYTSYNNSTNALSQDLSETGYLNSNLSYPVFLPLTYSYNLICIGDSYVLSQAIDGASNFYGLNSGTTDSHMMKNSEWGAVAYLTHSSYGRNGTEITINDYYTSQSSPYRTAVTGLASSDGLESGTINLSDVSAYNTINGMQGSTTGNVTGIYDLSGGVYERIEGYILNGISNLKGTGNMGSSGGLMGTTSIANPNGYQSLSTRNYMVYPYDNSSDSAPNNYTKYKGLLTSTYGYGDAILETSSDASNSWNSDYRAFVSQAYQFFMRGGYFNIGSSAGMFTFDGSGGSSNSCYGFRIILVSE